MNDQTHAQLAHLGVTPPISLNPPTQREIEVTDSLVQTLKDFGLFESEEESKRREIVLGKLDRLVKEFVYETSIKHSLPESIASEAGGKIFTYGSYRLGVHGPGTDIDTLCVLPKHIEREDFFTHMYDKLKANPEVTELSCVVDAFVPIIKMHFSGIDIDLICARLGLPSVPDDLELFDNNLLKNLDEKCVRSLNGSRVTDEILRLVPNIPSFKMALRCIKLWAKNRAIYANIMGFLGGVAWAMLVARVCQLYPNANAGGVVSKFFRIMYQWNWPQPVLLKQIEEGPLMVRVWNPKIYLSDKAHRMPIITPAYPSMCSTHNVSQSTQMVMTAEFKRAADLVDKIMIGKAQWPELFEKHDFFFKYKWYLQVIASSDSEENQLKWSGTVESKIRQLVMKLENLESIVLAHPFIKGFDKVFRCKSDSAKHDVAHGIFNAGVEVPDANKNDPPEEGSLTVHTSTFYIGLCVEPRPAGQTGPRKLDISWPIQDFAKMVKSAESYDETCMSIAVRHIKSNALPSDVFEGDERAKLKKREKHAKNKSQANTPDKPNKKLRSGGASKNESDLGLSPGTPSADDHIRTPASVLSSPGTGFRDITPQPPSAASLTQADINNAQNQVTPIVDQQITPEIEPQTTEDVATSSEAIVSLDVPTQVSPPPVEDVVDLTSSTEATSFYNADAPKKTDIKLVLKN
ncbi:polymerase [Basidiobolus meristosporus CBS 931.73]|uniref:Poly(A) polymerase n=1 Tax=Basidiobolus meristosporus CBS 931.73 TaxID=1314790 RepID=A0A1Y1ZBW1_9FUNG|nr:polymerase [Basidiobolus meristosporus CBS 931.73]|eukprot:ORY07740.1 polymerase [Basidiobolus meristosporus CBS 931.73]